MKKIAYLTIMILFFSCSEMEKKWVKEFAPMGEGNYRVNSLCSSPTGTYLTGTYWKTADKTCITAKYDEKGEVEWYKIYRHEGMKEIRGKSILKMCQGVCVHIQTTTETNVKNSVIVKYDSLGEIEWERTSKIPAGASELSSEMLADYEDNIYVAGSRSNRADSVAIFLDKYQASGELLWCAEYYNPKLHFSQLKFDVKKPNQFLIGGVLEDTHNFFFIRYDSLGNLLSLTRYESPERENILSDIEIGDHGNVYLTGGQYSNETKNDYLTVVYGENNNLIWAEKFDGDAHLNDTPRAIAFDESSNVYVTGTSEDEDGTTEIMTIKYDKDGNKLWSKAFKGRKREAAEPYILSPDFLCYGGKTVVRNFSIIGRVGNDMLLIKQTANGRISWKTRYASKNKVNIPTAFCQKCVAVQSITEKSSEAIILKYGTAPQFGVARWD